MTLLEYYEKGTIRELFEKGVISLNVYTYFRYYKVYTVYLEKTQSKMRSLELASDECGVDIRTISRAIKLVTS